MVAMVDLSLKRFGMLLVQSRAERDSTGKTQWACLCDCGSTKIVTALNLKSGNTKSCGCLKTRKGTRNPRTITDPSRIKERKRSFAAQRAWRKGIVSRDPRCLKCGSTDRLHAHHLEGYADKPEKREHADNGATLCASCHIDFHVKYGRRTGFNHEDFCEFVAGIREVPMVSCKPIIFNGRALDVIKYVTRWRDKGGIADLEKAKHYIEMLIELEGKKK
jgi:hypothetical protein